MVVRATMLKSNRSIIHNSVCATPEMNAIRMTDTLLLLNAGSSSLKFALYPPGGEAPFVNGQIEKIGGTPEFSACDGTDDVIAVEVWMQFFDPIEVNDDRAMDAYKLRRIELPFKIVHLLAQQMRRAADVQFRIIAICLNEIYIVNLQQPHAPGVGRVPVPGQEGLIMSAIIAVQKT